ncbi:MAG: type II toxin-antitoxin system RelE/ParE family toxin [Isosphaeraceae bacterium]
MKVVRVLPAADRDLDAHAGYLMEKASLETALRFYEAAAATFERLVQVPGLGEPYESNNQRLIGLRVTLVEGFPNHLVFYRAIDKGIEILRVLHGTRDLDRALESGTPNPETD